MKYRIEGAFLMARAAHDTEAMEVARVAAVTAVRSALAIAEGPVTR